MRIGTDQALHLTYCTNIHPGEQWAEVATNLSTYLPALKQQLSPHAPFGIGLRLSDRAAQELLTADHLTYFKQWLANEDLYVFTLNGFPYGGFHHQVVKDRVYAPDWSKPERLAYSLRLARILAALLPEGMDGGISTLPLSYKPWWTTDEARNAVFHQSAVHLAQFTAELVRSHQVTGSVLHLDLEPEPDGLLENGAEVVSFFQRWLLPVGGAWLAEALGISTTAAEDYLRTHIRVCYDTCHFAVEYEHPLTVLTQFQANGIQVGKVQLSAAIKIPVPLDAEKRQVVASHLHPFAESTYLHQVIERHPDGQLHHYPDLIHALPAFTHTTAEEWRTHFHVPIFVNQYHVFQSTQDDILTLLHHLPLAPECRHLEIETYTWDVLPADLKLDLLTSIRREYEWVLGAIAQNHPLS